MSNEMKFQEEDLEVVCKKMRTLIEVIIQDILTISQKTSERYTVENIGQSEAARKVRDSLDNFCSKWNAKAKADIGEKFEEVRKHMKSYCDNFEIPFNA